MVEKEDCDFLVELFTDIDTAVKALGRLVPIDLPRSNLDPLALTPIAIFDGEGIAVQDHRDPMIWITMPGQRLARRKT